MSRDPRVTLLCYDPQAPLRTLEIRGRVVDMTEQGAREHLDTLALSYTGKSFRELVPAALAESAVPVICRILPTHVVGFGCHMIPESHRDLLSGRAHGVLTTLMPDGQPQSSLLWWTTTVSARARTPRGSVRRDATWPPTPESACWSSTQTTPIATSSSGERSTSSRMAPLSTSITSRAATHSTLTSNGYVYPAEQASRETRIICRIHDDKVTLDAIGTQLRSRSAGDIAPGQPTEPGAPQRARTPGGHRAARPDRQTKRSGAPPPATEPVAGNVLAGSPPARLPALCDIRCRCRRPAGA